MFTEPFHTRFAPTPSGFLHRGNAYNALLCWMLARKSGGSLRLRIDDMDAARTRPEYVRDVFDSLAWLGLAWERGPQDPTELIQESQPLHVDRYEATLAALLETDRVYACTCSRAQLRADAVDGIYPGTCRDCGLPLTHPDAAWRIRLDGLPAESWNDGWLGPVSAWPSAEGDPIIRRRDGLPAYHICSLTDDARHGINLLVRGEDLLAATVVQRAIARLLSTHSRMADFLDADCVHHSLSTDEEGQKLSKSAGASSLHHLYEAGQTPATVWKELAAWLALPAPASISLDSLLAAFDSTCLPGWKSIQD